MLVTYSVEILTIFFLHCYYEYIFIFSKKWVNLKQQKYEYQTTFVRILDRANKIA